MIDLLRWEQQSEGSWYGYSGKMVVAMAVKPSVDNADGRWSWEVTGGRVPHGWKNYGETRTHKFAKRAVEKYWGEWLDHVGLMPYRPTEGEEE